MPPRYLRRASPTRLKPCQERMIETCDAVPADQCCGVIPCTLCLEWETYADGISYGSAVFSDSSWTGTVGGASFTAYWERNAYDVCEFVVLLDGDEVYRADCDNGASCRNPTGEAEAIVNYESGTVRWSVYEPLELQLIDDPETGCRDFFCDDCRCTCDELCVDVSEVVYTDFRDTYSGTLSNTAYPCDPPVWEGTVGNFELSLALGRDEYGQCIITPMVNGYEQSSVSAPGCSSMTATITLDDGSTITVRCKTCDCAETVENCICDRPLGQELTLLFASANAPATIHSVTLTYGSISESDITCTPFSPDPFPGYSGSFSGTLALPMGGSRSETMEFRLVCQCIDCPLCLYYRFGSQSKAEWCVTTLVATDCNCPALLTVADFDAGGCDDWSYQIFDITIVESSSNC